LVRRKGIFHRVTIRRFAVSGNWFRGRWCKCIHSGNIRRDERGSAHSTQVLSPWTAQKRGKPTVSTSKEGTSGCVSSAPHRGRFATCVVTNTRVLSQLTIPVGLPAEARSIHKKTRSLNSKIKPWWSTRQLQRRLAKRNVMPRWWHLTHENTNLRQSILERKHHPVVNVPSVSSS
jgi:hypothetical protein